MPRRFHRRRVLTHDDFLRYGGINHKPKQPKRGRLPSKADAERAIWARFERSTMKHEHQVNRELRTKMREDVADAIMSKIVLVGENALDPNRDHKMLDACIDAVLDLLNEPPKPAIDRAAEKIVYAIIGRINQEPLLEMAWSQLSPQRKAELATLWIELALGHLRG